jgi:hypothetical protein
LVRVIFTVTGSPTPTRRALSERSAVNLGYGEPKSSPLKTKTTTGRASTRRPVFVKPNPNKIRPKARVLSKMIRLKED